MDVYSISPKQSWCHRLLAMDSADVETSLDWHTMKLSSTPETNEHWHVHVDRVSIKRGEWYWDRKMMGRLNEMRKNDWSWLDNRCDCVSRCSSRSKIDCQPIDHARRRSILNLSVLFGIEVRDDGNTARRRLYNLCIDSSEETHTHTHKLRWVKSEGWGCSNIKASRLADSRQMIIKRH